MKVQLPSTVSSLQDLSTLTLEIREYAKWFAHNAIKERVHAKNVTPPPVLSTSATELIRSVGSKKLLSSSDLEQLIAALEEERFSRDKHTTAFPAEAARKPRRLRDSLDSRGSHRRPPGSRS